MCSTDKSITLEMNESAAFELSQIAEVLGLSQLEVLKKGLLLMGLCAEMKKSGKSSLILRNKETMEDHTLIVI